MMVYSAVFLLVILYSKASGSIRHYSLNNITWFKTKLHKSPTLYFELDFKVTFPSTSCCPKMFFSMYDGLYKEECFPPEIDMTLESWYKNSLFHLDNSRATTNVICALNSTGDVIICNSKLVADQDYIPTDRYIYFGYACDKVKNMTDLDLHLNMHIERNETICKETLEFEQSGNILKCKDFYPYTSLPNVFGDMSQADAKKAMEPFNSYFSYYQDNYCHKHLKRLVCMTFFPMCPFNNKTNSNQTDLSNEVWTTDHLYLPCREAAYEVVEACTNIGILIGLTIQYYPTINSNVTCYYEPVTCDKPPLIKNGKILENGTLFYAKDIVYYVCDNNFEMISENNYSVCSYSGFWTPAPSCIDPKVNATLLNEGKEANSTTNVMVILIVVGCILILTVVCAVIMVSRRMMTSREFTLNNNHDPISRNKPFDAFLSYESGASDEQFVRKEICPKLDLEYGGKFKLLIHQRDFKAGVLIMASIQNAVRDTNCAIILLSQTYIRSQWCKQEFEECMEECRKDLNYRLVVILMQPIEILQKEKLTPYMKTFLRSKTYLDREDSKFWSKLEELLEKHKTRDNIIIENETRL